MGLKYFWDSYAVAEFIAGSPNYAKFSHEPVVLSVFNLVEIYWIALREYGESEAEKIYEEFKKCVVEIDSDTIKDAVKFRKSVYKKRKISYADAIGYIYAVKNGLLFLTGDKEFEDIEQVEFWK